MDVFIYLYGWYGTGLVEVRSKMSNKEQHKIIRVHPELIELLEKIRNSINKTTWNIMDKNISWFDLTGILARKIKSKGII